MPNLHDHDAANRASCYVNNSDSIWQLHSYRDRSFPFIKAFHNDRQASLKKVWVTDHDGDQQCVRRANMNDDIVRVAKDNSPDNVSVECG